MYFSNKWERCMIGYADHREEDPPGILGAAPGRGGGASRVVPRSPEGGLGSPREGQGEVPDRERHRRQPRGLQNQGQRLPARGEDQLLVSGGLYAVRGHACRVRRHRRGGGVTWESRQFGPNRTTKPHSPVLTRSWTPSPAHRKVRSSTS